MSTADKIIYLLLLLVSLTLVGMIGESWRIILYPYLIVIGLAVLIGLIKNIKQNPKLIWIPVAVSVIYLALYIWLDIITIGGPTSSKNYIFGLTPSMAIYLLTIWPLANIMCLLYAWTFTYEKSLPQ